MLHAGCQPWSLAPTLLQRLEELAHERAPTVDLAPEGGDLVRALAELRLEGGDVRSLLARRARLVDARESRLEPGDPGLGGIDGCLVDARGSVRGLRCVGSVGSVHCLRGALGLGRVRGALGLRVGGGALGLGESRSAG